MDGRPGCVCAERAAETVHAERSAEAAASEDFDPLRIRPYVTLPNAGVPPVAEDPDALAPPVPPDAAETMRLRAVPADGTAPLPTVSADGAAPVRPVSAESAEDAPGGALGATGLRPGPRSSIAGEAEIAGGADLDPPPRNRKHRRLAALTIGAAAAVAIGTAAFASTLFAGDATPKQALPDAVDTGVPYSGTGQASADAPSVVPSRTKKAAPPHSAAPKPSAPPSPSASRAASPSPSKAAPSPSASASQQPSDGPGRQSLAPRGATLRRGDSGPAVLELQQRLAQLGLYGGSMDGTFGAGTERAVSTFQSYAGVDGDPAGVYGPQTRRALESMTDQP
ncbi:MULTISPECIES: peptidoglycan-binding protein [unclassified Streptomyces]|uniref:peptidoglycan-binding domain-containing protein n=1 Tax=unclassified Streptomyces TaxID=2593676 RepID=UPI0038024AA7